ncbi:CU044_5270 family protein [Micromonospora sp. WMMD1102]|uniref:CU044_5270 family protein n=1 Tax=Micromonospora sp. WMMD1102 TaxID=3016105 RepID=UPI0024152502|nr:CU044_5270 family protein [Micromonospora sp. WMMD1102]MDG4790978.1 CU044_5270 family protein [Micromonospora sp. WMMD1102]
MNPTSNQFDPDDRASLARLLPALAERDLPSDRHQRIQEFVMHEIHQDLHAAETPSQHAPKRRLAFLASALTAGAATAVVAVVIAAGGAGTSGDGSDGPSTGTVAGADSGAGSPRSGQQILLAAATTAENSAEASGTYWYTKVVSIKDKSGASDQYEYWTGHDGQSWFRGQKSGGRVQKLSGQAGAFSLGGASVSLAQLQQLPTEPKALQAAITEIVKNGDVRTSAGKLTAAQQENAVFHGLISLVSQQPTPPKVRAAAYRAIASYPNVTSLGPVKGGLRLVITEKGEREAVLVIDPTSSQITETNFFVPNDGGLWYASEGGSFQLTSQWTEKLPQ